MKGKGNCFLECAIICYLQKVFSIVKGDFLDSKAKNFDLEKYSYLEMFKNRIVIS